jgi:glycosyltransferase involved in cell wall biosynthesis
VARAYLVQDHEPEFYGTSAEASFAADTYRQGLPCIAASPWLAQLLRDRYGATASSFDLGVDHDTYRPGESSRRADLVVFYARASTPRRAVPLGLVALHELARRRPGIEIALFGGDRTRRPAFAHTDLGPLDPRRLARLYQEAAVGLSLSLTNPSLVGLEMMACGLPCVELASAPMRATFAGEDALELAAPEPLAIAAAIERVLDDPERREQMSARGVALTAARTWGAASAQVEAALREALPS